MHWASKRQTTREEDMAYCLFGLFDINLPHLYGEGKKAFHRLPEEIIKQFNDHTIFLWDLFQKRSYETQQVDRAWKNFLCRPPCKFTPSISQQVHGEEIMSSTKERIQISRKGICIKLYIKKVTPESVVQHSGYKYHLAALDCFIPDYEYITEYPIERTPKNGPHWGPNCSNVVT